MSADTTHIDICICTFRRPQIEDTLRSLSIMSIPKGYSISVIIADNDDHDNARDRILKSANTYDLFTTYIHAPARNISIARNACLDAVTAPIAIFIDDDERVSKEWLNALIQKYEETKAPLILGPMKAIYTENHPQWMKENDFHSINPVWVNGEIITGYTSNLLMDQSIPDIQQQRFLTNLGKSGGEDSQFMSALYKQGHKIEFAENAIVSEDVTDDRASFEWLFKRRLRMGQTHARISRNEKGKSAIALFMGAAAKMTFCLLMALIFFWSKTKASFWLLRATLHMGVIASLFGKQDLTLYGDA